MVLHNINSGGGGNPSRMKPPPDTFEVEGAMDVKAGDKIRPLWAESVPGYHDARVVAVRRKFIRICSKGKVYLNLSKKEVNTSWLVLRQNGLQRAARKVHNGCKFTA